MGLRLVACAGVLALFGSFALGCANGNPETTDPGDGTGGGGGGGECAGRADGTPCGDSGSVECDQADTCEGGVCVQNVDPEGTACGDSTDSECNPADTCDGMGTCVQRIGYEGEACGDPTDDACTAPDTCDGMGTCLGNHQTAGYGCGDPSVNDCTGTDTCDGEGACLRNDEPEGTACGSQIDNQCTDPDTCDGMGVCLDNHAAEGVTCGLQTDDECTNPDTCDGAGLCDSNHEAVGTACGNGANTDCTDPDSCDGSGACLVNHENTGTLCNDCSQGAGLCDGCSVGICTDACIPPPGSLLTLLSDNNGINGVMFDVVAKTDITVTTLETNLSSGTHNISIWYIAGGYDGHETTQGDWTFVTTVNGVVSNGQGNATEIPYDLDLPMQTGQRYGIYLSSSGTIRYTDGTTEFAVLAQNTELQVLEGRGVPNPVFNGSLQFVPRDFNGIVNYEIGCL